MSDKPRNLITVCAAALFLFGFSLWSVCKPQVTQSASERRALAVRPALSAEAVLSGKYMSDFEKYTLDQFPLRDEFRTVKAITVLSLMRQKDNNGIYIKDGYAAKLEYPMSTDSVDYAAKRFQFIYDRYLSGNAEKVYLSVIPDKNYWTAKENGYLSMDYDRFISELRRNTDFAEYIDITGQLTLDDYYCTDAHWRQEKITDVAGYLAAYMGIALPSDYSVADTNVPFYGVYYGQSALPMQADKLVYLRSDVIDGLSVFDYEANAEIPLYDVDLALGRDPYEMFLSGSKSLLTIKNPSASSNKELILFRDSFGSSIAPLLAQGYSKITLVDIRYLSPTLLGEFIDFAGSDVLFLFSTSILNNSITLK